LKPILAIVAVLGATVLGGCSSPPSQVAGLQSRPLGTAIAEAGDLAWTDDGLIAVGGLTGARYSRYDDDDRAFRDQPLSSDDCDHIQGLRTATPIAPDRVGGVLVCKPGELTTDQVVDVHIDSGEASPLLGAVRYGADAIGFSPDRDEAVVGQSSGDICASVRWLGPAGEEVRDVEVGDGQDTWSLAAMFRASDEQDRLLSQPTYDVDAYPNCEDAGGLAREPAWSSRDQIALFISPESQRRSGAARIKASFGIWVMASDGRDGRFVLEDVTFPEKLAWSPNGACLAFVGMIDGTSGLWVKQLASDDVQLLVPDHHWSFAWSPDTGEMAVGTAGLAGQVDVISGPELSNLCFR